MSLSVARSAIFSHTHSDLSLNVMTPTVAQLALIVKTHIFLHLRELFFVNLSNRSVRGIDSVYLPRVIVPFINKVGLLRA